jgi:hypothetical protein
VASGATIAKRLNWHDFPELEQRGKIPPPKPSLLPQLYQDSGKHDHSNHQVTHTNTLWQRDRRLPNGYIDPDKRY